MTSSYAVLFKTLRWDAFVERQLERLREVCPGGTIIVFKDQTKSFDPIEINEAVIHASENTCSTIGLAQEPHDRVFWYNGDYPLYYLYSKYPNFDYYMMVEYDCWSSVNLDQFVRDAAIEQCDLVVQPIETPLDQWPWTWTGRDAYGPGWTLRPSFLCFALFSGRAVEFLLRRRQELSIQLRAGALSAWPQAELFVSTELAHAGFSIRRLSAFGNTDHCSWWPPTLESDAVRHTVPSFVHPVLDEASYILALLRHEDDLSRYFDRSSELRRQLDMLRPEATVPVVFEELRRRRETEFIERLKQQIPESQRERLDAHFNVARGKRATQSSISQWSRGRNVNEDAGGAVNGVITGGVGFHTDEEDNPWWMVDLETPHDLSEIRIFNRLDVPHRARRLSIWISLSAKDWRRLYRHPGDFGGADGDPLRVIIPEGARGRFVRVELEERSVLHLDEVQVFGAPSSSLDP